MAYKLLLADDSITIQKIVELMLAGEGFEIKVTSNGEEALAVIPSFKPDLLLADIEMPRINGYQLCEKIKKDPSTSGIPVILLAGAFEPIDEILAKQVRADDFIIKPFETQELISKINAVLEAPAIAEEAVGVAEVAGVEGIAEEDLWVMEEVLEVEEVESWPEEAEAVVSTEKPLETVERAEIKIEEVIPEEMPPVSERVAHVEVEAGVPELELLSKDELKEIFDKTLNERISSLLSSLDIKEAILSLLIPSIKDSVEKILPELTEKVLKETLGDSIKSLAGEAEKVMRENILGLTEKLLKETLEDSFRSITTNVEKVMWATISGLTEGMLKEMLENSLKSLSGEIEKVIWETVPDLAETIISKEIERIRSEF
jgi:DNA-binding response OmpR family regulator